MGSNLPLVSCVLTEFFVLFRKRHWYQKKKIIIPMILLIAALIAALIVGLIFALKSSGIRFSHLRDLEDI